MIELPKLALATVLLGSALFGCSQDEPPATKEKPEDFALRVLEKPSCLLECSAPCNEIAEPWKCPALAEWGQVPHAESCNPFDGKTYPLPVSGTCHATDPTGEALKKASLTATPVVLPDGRRLQPEGKEWLFSEAGFGGGFPASVILVPGTRWLLVNDNGYARHSLRVIDTAVLKAGGGSPIAGVQYYDPPAALNYGVAYHSATKTVYAASGDSDAVIRAFSLDESTGALTANPTKTLPLPPGTLPQAIAISPNGKTLLVGQATPNDNPTYRSKVIVTSLDAATYGQELGRIDLRTSDVFSLRFDPDDPAGNTAYASMWTGPDASVADDSKMRVWQLDVAALKASAILVGKAPEEMAFLDARYLVVANSLSDSLSVIDRPASSIVRDIPIGGKGWGPSALAYDAPRKRLYAALSGMNGIAAFDVSVDVNGVNIVPAGIFATGWWPTGIAVEPSDGTVFVSNGRGHGTGADARALGLEEVSISNQLRGSIQSVPFMTGSDLAQATTRFETQNDLASLPGYPRVECNGAPYDFPVPEKVEAGPSGKIKHVFLVVRENKTFDDLFGDLPGVDGDPKLVLSPGHMNEIWGNARRIATDFAHMDNYYLDAEQSIQGHTWTVFGRSTDYAERRWLVIWGRGEFSASSYAPGVGSETIPLEGTIFSDLGEHGVSVDKMGELIGGLKYRSTEWPGSTTEGHVPDTLGACYMAARLRALCNPKDFTYLWLNNDHTLGLDAHQPNPAIMIGTNDEGTGMVLDGLSHSPFWQDSLFIVIEDDPNGGGDHVDQHRTIALFASPWVKRKYVSHAHYDIASVHKLLAHIYGKPYRNATIAHAPLPLDLFTSTPDYTPFSYQPQGYKDRSCNPSGTAGAQKAAQWNFSEPDEQPGLSEQVRGALRELPASSPP